MNNEPVALTQIEIMNALTLGIPLYTHPQANRIAELEKLVSEMKYEKSSGVYEMNNEPVAWGYKDFNGDISDCICPEEHDRAEGDYTIPLYTHPVKELTDAEIQQVSHKYHYTYNPDYIGFARAILRKAQEK